MGERWVGGCQHRDIVLICIEGIEIFALIQRYFLAVGYKKVLKKSSCTSFKITYIGCEWHFLFNPEALFGDRLK